MRPLIVAGAFALFPGESSATKACKKLANSIMVGGQLSKAACEDLDKLHNDPSMKKAVEHELTDLFHELSKPAHFVSNTLVNGIVCGGKLPLKAALALLYLEMQRKNVVQYKVRYVDDSGKELFQFCSGRIEEKQKWSLAGD